MKGFRKLMLAALAAVTSVSLFAGVTSVKAKDITVDETGAYTQSGYSLVADCATSARIDVPTSLGELEDKTNVTATFVTKGTDFTPYNNDYTNDPYVIIRENAEKSYQVWYRVIRNGMLQVFAGKIGTTENVVLNVNAWQQHTAILSSWTIKVVSSATSAEFFVGDQSYGTVSYDATPVAYGIDFAAGFYGYLSDLSLTIGGKEYVTIDEETKVEGFTVSDLFVGASANTVEMATLLSGGKYIKNKTTGKYENISDLETEIRFTAVDTGATIGQWWEVPVVGFFRTTEGVSVGVRNGSNGITQIFTGNAEGAAVYSPVYHGYYDVDESGNKVYNFPYAYGVTVKIKDGKADVALGNRGERTVYHSNVELGEGVPYFTFGNNGATAYCGISVKVVGEGEYDYNDIVDAQYLNLIDVQPEEGKVGYFTYSDGCYTDANAEGDYSKQVSLSTAFDGEGFAATKMKTVLSYTVAVNAVPESIWLVPGVTFWQDEQGVGYDLQAYNASNTYIMKNCEAVKELGFCSLNTSGTGSYSVSITIEGGTAKILIDGAQGNGLTGEFTLPAGKPVVRLFTRGTPATFSNVKFYTTSIDNSVEGGIKTYAKSMSMTEAPVAEKFGDELTGGRFTVTYSDGTTKEVTLADEGVTTNYDGETLGEQNVVVRYEDETSVLTASTKITLSDYATRIVVDLGKEEFAFGEEIGDYVVTAIMASGAEADVTETASVSGYDKNVSGAQTVSFSYQGLTVTADVTVREEEKQSEPESAESSEPASEETSASVSVGESAQTGSGCASSLGSLGGLFGLTAVGFFAALLKKKEIG